MADRLRVHLLILPRWFALPVALSGIALGGVLAGAPGWNLALVLVCGTFLMAYSHSFNSVADWLLGFDRGPVEERSRKKLYTSGQNVIAEGRVSLGGVLLNSLAWLAAAFVVAAFLAERTSPWVWLPVVGSTLCALWYSPAKKMWHPEVPLGLGFGPFAVMIGAAASSSPDLWRAFLAGVPYGFLFGVVCEEIDQAADYKVNWAKGLRSIGPLLLHHGISLRLVVAVGVTVTYLLQVSLVIAGILHVPSFLSLIALPAFLFTASRLERQYNSAAAIGLVGVFVYSALVVLGEALWA